MAEAEAEKTTTKTMKLRKPMGYRRINVIGKTLDYQNYTHKIEVLVSSFVFFCLFLLGFQLHGCRTS